MFPVSDPAKAALADPKSRRRCQITVGADTTLVFTDMDTKSLNIKEQVSDDNTLVLGGVYQAECKATLSNSTGKLEGTQFQSATLLPEEGVEISPGTYEWIPLGVYTVYNVQYQNDTVELSARCNLTAFDRSFSGIAVNYPIKAGDLLTLICQYCGVARATPSFLNDNYSIAAAPDGSPSCRDMVSYIAELAGCFARCDRYGALELGWFENAAPALGEANLDGGDFSGPTTATVTGASVTFDSPLRSKLRSVLAQGHTNQIMTQPSKNLFGPKAGSLSAVGSAAATQVFAGGNFAKDTNGDGLADGFVLGNGAIAVSCVNNTQTFIGSAQHAYIRHDLTSTASHRYLLIANVKAESNQVQLRFRVSLNSGGTYVSTAHPGDGQYHILAVMGTVASDYNGTSFYLQDEGTSGWSNISVQTFMIIDMGSDATNPFFSMDEDKMAKMVQKKLKADGSGYWEGSGQLGGVDVTVDVDQSITLDGVAMANPSITVSPALVSGQTTRTNPLIVLASGQQYTFSRTAVSGSYTGSLGFFITDNAGTTYPTNWILSTSNASATITAGTPYITGFSSGIIIGGALIQLNTGATYNNYKFLAQFEQSASATPWVPFVPQSPSVDYKADLSGVTKLTVNGTDYPLPRTLWDGDSYDQVSGSGSAARALVTLPGTESWGAGPANTLTARFDLALLTNGALVDRNKIKCNRFNPVYGDASDTEHCRNGASSNPNTLVVYVFKSRMPGYSDAWTDAQKIAAFKSLLSSWAAAGAPLQVVYELATPAPITGTPTEIRLQEHNSFTTDGGGQLAVTYPIPYQTGDNADGGDFTHYNNAVYDGGLFAEAVPGQTLDGSVIYDQSYDGTPVTITGVSFELDGTTYLRGSARYAIALSDNPLLTHDIDVVLQALGGKLIGFSYIMASMSWPGNPALQAGDLISCKTRADVTYRTIVTSSGYKYLGQGRLTAGGTAPTEVQYRSQSSKQYSRITASIAQKQDQLDALDFAMKNAMLLLSGTLGGHFIDGDTLPEEEYHGNLFIANTTDVTTATKVWRWNLGGFAFYPEGLAGPVNTAITADGSIFAQLITAAMIQTGLLRSLNGKSWIDLDDGTFNFGNGALVWDGSTFRSLSAEKLTNANSDGTNAVIGQKAANQYGFFLYDKTGHTLYQVYPTTGAVPPDGVLFVDHGIKSVTYSRGGGTAFLKTGDAGTSLQWWGSGEDASITLDDLGVSFTKNGNPFGLDQEVQVNTPTGVRTIRFIKGIPAYLT